MWEKKRQVESRSIQVFVICIGYGSAYVVPMFMNIETGDIHPGKWSDPYAARLANAVQRVAAVSMAPKKRHLVEIFSRWLRGEDGDIPFVCQHKVRQANLK